MQKEKQPNYVYCVELYYARRAEDPADDDVTVKPIHSSDASQKLRDNEEGKEIYEKDLRVILKDKFYITKQGVGYRNPFQSPIDSFLFNQVNYHGYMRVIDKKQRVVWNAFLYNKELHSMAHAYARGEEILWSTSDGIVGYDCDRFNEAVICQKITFFPLKAK